MRAHCFLLAFFGTHLRFHFFFKYFYRINNLNQHLVFLLVNLNLQFYVQMYSTMQMTATPDSFNQIAFNNKLIGFLGSPFISNLFLHSFKLKKTINLFIFYPRSSSFGEVTFPHSTTSTASYLTT